MGYTLHHLEHPGFREDLVKQKNYLQNALATIPKLIMTGPTLTSACLLHSNFELPSTNALLAIAIQQGHTLGIHREDFAGKNPDSERRARVCWLGYTLDKMICSPQGLDPYEDEANSMIPLPDEDLNIKESSTHIYPLVILTLYILDNAPGETTTTNPIKSKSKTMAGDLQLVCELSTLISNLGEVTRDIASPERRWEALQLLINASRHHVESAERAIGSYHGMCKT
ncbi:hypothetical protein BJX99DRAFT_265403 [Aspergillus californicus]